MSEQKQTWTRPDASMSLLADLFGGEALDPGYAEAAARGERPARARFGVLAVLLVVGLILAVAGAQFRRGKPAALQQRERLISDITDRSAAVDELQHRAADLADDNERLRASALARSKSGRTARSLLTIAGEAAAASPLTGPAVDVTVRDSEKGDRVLDQDLQIVVNGLWAAGARGIAVNGQRMTATTAIRSAGEAILVDYRPLIPPYRVQAVGARPAQFTGGAAGGHLRMLRDRYGIQFDLGEEPRATLPAAAAQRLRYALKEGGP
jgi:uncharacterized protein YlxW (UPF0749 family)